VNAVQRQKIVTPILSVIANRIVAVFVCTPSSQNLDSRTHRWVVNTLLCKSQRRCIQQDKWWITVDLYRSIFCGSRTCNLISSRLSYHCKTWASLGPARRSRRHHNNTQLHCTITHRQASYQTLAFLLFHTHALFSHTHNLLSIAYHLPELTQIHLLCTLSNTLDLSNSQELSTFTHNRIKILSQVPSHLNYTGRKWIETYLTPDHSRSTCIFQNLVIKIEQTLLNKEPLLGET
jgi:hypothetical protein